MGKIIIDDDSSLESVEVRFDHLLLDERESEQEKQGFRPLTDMLEERFGDFPPHLVSIGRLAKASSLIKGRDEVEIFFLMILAGDEKPLLFRTLEKNREALGETFYQEMLCLVFLAATAEERDQIMQSILQVPAVMRTPLCALLVALFSAEPQVVAPDGTVEREAALFLEALKAERNDNIAKAFGDILRLFSEHDRSRFLYEYLRALILRHDTIPVPLVAQFAETVLKSPLAVSYASVKLLEFLYYWRNDVVEKIEETVTALAEATDSLFVLNAIAPLLYRYEKWHLLGKFYKLAARKTTGKTRIRYLELLADIYEHKLRMPEFATEIHKNIVEEDPASCSISLSLVLSVYEENRQWEDLANLYLYLADREKEPKLAAYYLFRGGELLFRELGRPAEARPRLEQSLRIHRSFEIIRLLSELYLVLQDYDAYIANLEQELSYASSIPEQITLHDKIADALVTFKRAYGAAEAHLLAILDLKPDRIETVKKLGKIYYTTRNWEKLTAVNAREIALSENTSDIVNLLYKNGTIYFNEMHDYGRARQSFLQILSIVKHHIPSLLYLEKIYLHENAVDEIIALYNDLLQSAVTDSETKEFYLTRLAIVYREQGRIKEAQDTFRLVEYLYPDSTIAKENLRLLGGDVLFHEFTLDEFDSGEFSSLIAESDHPSDTKRRLEMSEPSFHKYLWELAVHGEATVPDEALTDAEKNLRTVLEGRPSLGLLSRHAARPALLTLLAEQYLKKGYLKGIYTILAYHLSLHPTTKSTLWSVFFMGADHPELKEKLDALLVTEKEMQHFEIALSILEKIHLLEGNHRAILLMRTIFAKKLKDPTAQRRFIDETIRLLTGHLDPADLIDLYRTRYRISTGYDRDEFLKTYREFLSSLGMFDTLIGIYEEKWRLEGKEADGDYLLDLYLSRRTPDKAVALLNELLDRYPENAALDRVIDFFERTQQSQAANDLLQTYLQNAKNPETARTAAQRLIRDHLEKGNIAEAVNLFHGIPFTDEASRFTHGMDLAERILALNQSAFAIQIARTLRVESSDEAVRRTVFLCRCGAQPIPEDIEKIPSYDLIRGPVENIRNREIIIETARHFALRRDVTATGTLLKQLFADGRIDEARRFLDETSADPRFRTPLFQSFLFRAEGQTVEERELLSQTLITALRNGDAYPLDRLVETVSSDNRRASFFAQNLRAALGISGMRPAENEWHHLSLMREDLVLAQAGFTALDEKLRRFGQLLAAASPATSGDSRHIRPITAAVSRPLSTLVEKLALALREEALTVFFDPDLDTVISLEALNTPAIILGPTAEKVSRKRVAFLIAQHHFLAASGVTTESGKGAVGAFVARIMETLSFSSKERSAFLRTLRRKHQEEVRALMEEIGNPSEPLLKTFGERLFLAAVLSAFTIIPDLKQVCASADESLDSLEIPDSAVANAYSFALATFFE